MSAGTDGDGDGEGVGGEGVRVAVAGAPAARAGSVDGFGGRGAKNALFSAGGGPTLDLPPLLVPAAWCRVGERGTHRAIGGVPTGRDASFSVSQG